MQEGQAAKYELLVSASAVSLQVDALQIGSAFNLFQAIAGMTIGGLNLTIESWACSLALGEPVLYRLLLRESNPLEITTES